MHRVYAPDATGVPLRVAGGEAHHLIDVLRLRPGAAVIVFDGAGREWQATIAAVNRRDVDLDAFEPRVSVPEPPVAITLAMGLLKGDRMSDVVRDATMLGVAAVVPVISTHVVVAERVWRALEPDRWTRVAVASAKQSGRSVVPRIWPVARLDDVLTATPPDAARLVAVEPHHPLASAPVARPPGGRATVFVGPEGGWSDAEVAALIESGARAVTLGPRTLRAEVAPVVVLTALWSAWGWT